ncbi:hypothetical protein JTB14_035668 [Gonioctena quinquepunctata]|nr:hypothetical protein JTB14_035668 [Gonioctena quinquepunctata]
MQVSSSGDEEDDQQVTHGTYVWGPVTGSYLKKFDFLETENGTGFKAELYETMYNKTPYDFYKLFVNDDIINLMVTETNRYADQCIEKTVYRNARDTYVFSCGDCEIVLGTLNEIVNNGIAANHNCFEGASNVNLNYESKQMFREVVVPQLQTVQQTVGHSYDEDSQRKKSNVWEEEEVALLIATYKIHKEKFNIGMLSKKKVWDIISTEMKLHGVIKDGVKCDDKWRNLKKAYDEVKMSEKSGNGERVRNREMEMFSGNIFKISRKFIIRIHISPQYALPSVVR